MGSTEPDSSPTKSRRESESALEHSDSDLEIDLDSTLVPRHSSSPIPPKHEQTIIETFEDELEKQLTEKAKKTNLTVTNVKTIIRQVLRHEFFTAMLEKKDSDDGGSVLSYEPKLTRAKTKELLSSNTIQTPSVRLPWVPQPPPSETHVLIGDDLKEDDSGDEYVPGEEESEDDRDGSITSESEVGSLPPPTPPMPVSMEDQATQTTNFTDDGVFKIPPPKSTQKNSAEEAANIALRTRSKINLSSTPLEVIENSFVPPDITTDMYDMECDDDEWREFLKGFTEPLEEATKPTEDEEHDPEYNILADDEINDIDKEDFRIDKAVKITKKEVKELWEELFEYLHHISEDYDDTNQNKGEQSTTVSEFFENSSLSVSQADISQLQDSVETTAKTIVCNEHDTSSEGNKSAELSSTSVNSEKDKTALLDVTINHQTLCIIELQFRQHVQMLTQNFFLTYNHPEFHQYSAQFQEYLLNLKFLSEGKTYSVFRPVNLLPALKLIDDWIYLCDSNSDDVKVAKEHVQQDLEKSLQCKMAGNWGFVPTFPKLLLEIISKSEVFLFPSLLPKIPFKSEQFFIGRTGFTDAEDDLLAFGFDMFKSFLLDQMKPKSVTTAKIVQHIQQYMMPHRNARTILKHIYQSKHPRCSRNPIQLYFLKGKLKPVVHSLHALNQIMPPHQRLPDELPIQWRNFIYPWYNETTNTITQNVINIGSLDGIGTKQQIILINSPFYGNNSLFSSPVALTKSKELKTPKRTPRKPKQTPKTRKRRSTKNNTILENSLTSIEQIVSIFLRPVPVQKLVRFLTGINENRQERLITPKRLFVKIRQNNNLVVLPNMPNLNTPIKYDEKRPEEANNESAATDHLPSESLHEHEKPETVTSCTISKEKLAKSLEFSTITSSSFQKANSSREVEFCLNSNNMQVCQTSQCDKLEAPKSGLQQTDSVKDNPEDINALMIASSVIKPESKPNIRKEQKKNKLRKEFMANLSMATPPDPESEKHKNEMFAVAYYDKLRETLEFEDYHKIMQILNDFTSGDVIDLYNDVQAILRPKYTELAEEFLFFLKEKEASAVGQLIPWLELQARTKFLRKLEIFLKDQPAQLKKIYNTLMELTKTENITLEKVKSVLVPLLKGNSILLDLFLQNFRDERPPPSLLGDQFETIDIHKELARPDNEELYETFVVPNTEDKYGGNNCICHCHKIEDNEYKSRYKHCNACGLKFANGRLFLSAGRTFQPATVTFKTNPDTNHNARLLGKSTVTVGHKKKRTDGSPNKLASAKENLEEDTEDEEQGKRKKSISQKNPRKRKKTDTSKYQETGKPASPKKSPVKSTPDIQKDSIKPRKRTYSGKRAKKEENNKKIEPETDRVENLEIPVEKIPEECEIIAEIEESEHETSEEHGTEKVVDDCMDSSGESLEKPLTPEQQTAESESEVYLEESSQDNYESDDSTSSAGSTKGSQSDNNTNDEPAWKREEDTVILETLQKEDDKEYALQIISDKIPNRTISQIRSRLSRLMDLLIETLKTPK